MADLDLVVFGATGFTGSLTARYLADHAPAGLRWAVAGRSRNRLAALRDQLGVEVPLIEADVADQKSMLALAEATRVLVTTVGPYLLRGEPAVAACAATGTDYVDLAGEAEFVDSMYLRHQAMAERTGARLVHACGFDSVPHDLGALYTVRHLPSDQPIRLNGYVRASAGVSGGTLASAVTALARSGQAARARADRRRVEPQPANRSVRALRGRLTYTPEVGAWVLPLPTIDPQIVTRSAAALEAYGPDFTYSHYWVAGGAARAALTSGLLAGAFALAKLPPAARLVRRRWPAGTGPAESRRENSWFTVRFVGTTAGGQRVVTEVSGGDPGYSETAKMLAEAAICLATDELPAVAGQLTTAVAMGDRLLGRLQRAGLPFRLVDQR